MWSPSPSELGLKQVYIHLYLLQIPVAIWWRDFSFSGGCRPPRPPAKSNLIPSSSEKFMYMNKCTNKILNKCTSISHWTSNVRQLGCPFRPPRGGKVKITRFSKTQFVTSHHLPAITRDIPDKIHLSRNYMTNVQKKHWKNSAVISLSRVNICHESPFTGNHTGYTAARPSAAATIDRNWLDKCTKYLTSQNSWQKNENIP